MNKKRDMQHTSVAQYPCIVTADIAYIVYNIRLFYIGDVTHRPAK